MWYWWVELTSYRIPPVLQGTIQKIGTGQETNPWSLENRSKQDEQWQWSHDTNDNGDGHDVGQPETERQKLLQLRREFEQQQQLLLRERAQLLLERQRQQLLLERARLLREEQHLFQDNVDARGVRVERRQQLPQRQAFETHVLSGSNDNKPNCWKRIRKRMQRQFLCPWSNQILNLPILANNNKRSESVCVMGVWSVVSAKNAARR